MLKLPWQCTDYGVPLSEDMGPEFGEPQFCKSTHDMPIAHKYVPTSRLRITAVDDLNSNRTYGDITMFRGRIA